MTWFYKNNEFTEEQVGAFKAFVYCITNLESGRKYVGKKKLLFKKTKTVKKKKLKFLAPSDWQDYYGSSQELKDDVEALGKEKFRREILHLCLSPAESSYLELYEQITRNALLSNDYYNNFVGARIHRNHVKKLIEEYNVSN
jgi:hypothetical protein